MTLRTFEFLSLAQVADTVAALPNVALSPLTLPDFSNQEILIPQGSGFDKFGWFHQDGQANGGVPRLFHVRGASVQRRSLDRDRWHIVIDEGICARESYHDGRWVAPHIGEQNELKIVWEDRAAEQVKMRFMDYLPIDGHVEEPHVLISSFWAENYAHSILESASKFWWEDNALTVNDKLIGNMKVIWECNRPWQTQIADLIAPKRRCVMPGNRVVYDHLYVPTTMAPIGGSKAQVDWLRAKFGSPTSLGRRRILISRADATERRVDNENALSHYLENYGFETVMLSGMSVREQIDLFADAEAVIAPHGAGCVNALWMAPGARFIELVPATYTHPMFWYIAKWCGHWYARILCPPKADQTNDMRADLDVIGDALKSAGIEPAGGVQGAGLPTLAVA